MSDLPKKKKTTKPRKERTEAEFMACKCPDLGLGTYVYKGDVRRINPAVKKYAHEMYMNFYPVPEIAKRTGITKEVLAQYANNKGEHSWKFERQLFSNQILTEFADSKRPGIAKILSYSLTVLGKALENLMEDPSTITVDDAVKVSKIYDNLDKVVRLDEQSPTSIIQKIKPASIVEIQKKVREKMAKDPWFKIESAEYVELNDNTNSENPVRVGKEGSYEVKEE